MVISPTPETNWASPVHLCLRRKRQRGVGFRIPRKAFRLCVRDVYGTRALDDPGVALRPTPLQREIELRTSGRQITAFLRRYAGGGGGGVMGSWAAYRQAIPALGSLTSRLNGILRRYNGRRIEIGLFYLAPRMIGSRGLTVRTHLLNLRLRRCSWASMEWSRRRHATQAPELRCGEGGISNKEPGGGRREETRQCSRRV
ncbi:hypothetical protein GQ55_7G200200 [Panicum hallii var. hallii]|uniref:Uncharacterized protein n=1 Tax=Panicum hallii var. hallii TaxID=1504633 RepID=A0A2T7CX17_9POAL|nr:hypothetical protein GQ55_7G200200 [Panicum hallii var. hallii]